MAYGESSVPTAPDYYRTGLLASALAYLGILLLMTISAVVGGSGSGTAFSIFFIGGLYGLIPAAGIAFLITAPLGCLFGIALREWLEPGEWHGALNGAMTAVALLALAFLLIGGELRAVPDAETMLFIAGIIAVGAGSGWIAQRKVLGWPSYDPEEDAQIFE